MSNTMTAGRRALVARLMSLVFFAFGSVALAFGWSDLTKARASVDWPSAKGRITDSHVRSERNQPANDSAWTSYHVSIAYEYEVDGRSLTGSRVSFGDHGSSDKNHAQQIVKQYPKGKVVTVHYMQEDPAECLLEPGVKWQTWLIPGVGLAFIVFGCIFAVITPSSVHVRVGRAR